MGFVVARPSVTKHLGDLYERMPSFSEEAVPAFKQMHKEVSAQFEQLQKHLKVETVDHDPYQSPAHMFEDVRQNRRLKVLSSEVTGGHPIFGVEGNDQFRAVHDFIGHFGTQRGFDRHGEEAAYLAHARTMSPLARRALATETRGQNSYLITRGQFTDNKIGLLPPQFSGTQGFARSGELPDVERQARQFHRQQGL